MAQYKKNTVVEWNRGTRTAVGKIEESFTNRVTRTINGNRVTRRASTEEPAYLVRLSDGDRVLKSHSELTEASKKTLEELAREEEIEGRSRMDRKELINAIW